MMRTKLYFSLIVLGLLAAPLQKAEATPTARELDTLQAHLNTQWGRVEEIGTAYGSLKKIRQEKILGAYFPAVDAWHREAQVWLKAWQPILKLMEGSQLASDVKQVEMQNLLKAQAVGVENLAQKIPVIAALGTDASRALGELKSFDPKYVDLIPSDRSDSFGRQIGVYNQVLSRTKQNLATTQAAFSRSLMNGFPEMTQRASKNAMDKIKALALTFPELKSALARIEQSLTQMRLVDATIDLMNQESLAISLELAQEHFFTGRKRLEAFRVKVQAEIDRIAKSPELSETAKTYGRDTLLGILRVRDSQLNEMLRTRASWQILASFYSKSLNGASGMIERCRATPQPKDIDCNRLRLVVGFKNSQLAKLNDKAAAYIEEQILRAKLPSQRL